MFGVSVGGQAKEEQMGCLSDDVGAFLASGLTSGHWKIVAYGEGG